MCDVNSTGQVHRSDFVDLIRSLKAIVGVDITDNTQNNVINKILHQSGVKPNSDYLTTADFEAIFAQAGKGRPVGVELRGAKLKMKLEETASLNSFAVPTSTGGDSVHRSVFGTIAAVTGTYRQHIFILFIFCCTNLMIFLERFRFHRYENQHLDQHRVMGVGIAITRGAAGAVSFCLGVVLLTVCRNVITIVRETPLGEFIPFDSAIGFHKIVALFAAFWATVHTIGHCVNFYHIASQSKEGLHCLFQEAVAGTFNEWHAFSLASAPQSPTVELYIKAVGPWWTWKLRSQILRTQAGISPYPLLHMRGPYGDGNQEWTNYEVAVLVGGGIGVTPYASTLTDLVLETASAKHHNVKCKKVYFLWVCPTHKNYEWFVDVLKGVEELDQNKLLETHIFVTQFFHKFDLRTTMLYICEKHFRGDHQGKSMFTGLRAQNHFGRPNFDTFFSFIQNVHSEVPEIGVFSCGPSKLNGQISSACARANRALDAPSFMHRFETF
ncbi:ferric reductase NAD binding domain protein [Ostertagia ostertagi]